MHEANGRSLVRSFLIHGKAQDGQAHSYEVTFGDLRGLHTKTDLNPRIQVPSGASFPDPNLPPEQWQLDEHQLLPAGGPSFYYNGGLGVCPECLLQFGYVPILRTGSEGSATTNVRDEAYGVRWGHDFSPASSSIGPRCYLLVVVVERHSQGYGGGHPPVVLGRH